MKATVYGDSILKGVLLEDGRYVVNRAWEEQAAAQLGVTIRNRSRFGCTIDKALDVIRRDSAQSAAEEEYAVLELGGNDCDYNWAAISEAPEEEHTCKTPPERFLARYREAVDLLVRSGRTPVLLTLPPIHSERYLRFICRNGLSRQNILRWMGDVEAIARWQAAYSAMVEVVAREKRTRLIDLRRSFAGGGDALEEQLCADGIHPSRLGQGIILRALCAQADGRRAVCGG